MKCHSFGCPPMYPDQKPETNPLTYEDLFKELTSPNMYSHPHQPKIEHMTTYLKDYVIFEQCQTIFVKQMFFIDVFFTFYGYNVNQCPPVHYSRCVLLTLPCLIQIVTRTIVYQPLGLLKISMLKFDTVLVHDHIESLFFDTINHTESIMSIYGYI